MKTEATKTNKRFILAVDVGGTKTALSVVTEDGSVVGESQVPTRGQTDANDFVVELVGAFNQTLTALQLSLDDVALVSMSLAARCFLTADGTNFLGDNIPAIHVPGGVPLPQMISDVIGIPVVALNDGVAAALGEQGAVGGAAYGEPNIITVIVGTGTGGAVVSNGQPVFFDLATVDGESPSENSENRNGPEIGHWRVDNRSDAPLCGCVTDPDGSNRGHLEALFSGKALETAGLNPKENLSLLYERGLAYLPEVLIPLIQRYSTQKIVIAAGIGAALMDNGFGEALEAKLQERLPGMTLDVVKANFDNASLKGAERYGQLNIPRPNANHQTLNRS